ncbi:MAG: hypothetical protein SOR38_09295 [Oscillospiraceae bacterium]|nr:hypothetical protein [Oscillospiraceae bacterium]MDY3065979.1 hypothetical protein [Oscillospiraceae bacterium]
MSNYQEMLYEYIGYAEENLSREEIQDLVEIKKARDIRTIKKCAVFFSAALACQLAAALILLIVTLSAAG